MKGKAVLAIAVALAVLAAAAFIATRESRAARGYIDPSDTQLVQRGRPLYDQYCAACHGKALEGQPEWRKRLPNGRLPAPPHDESGHTWHHPDAVLIDIVRNGLVPGRTAPDGYESDMPAYAGTLSDDDIAAVLAYIKSRWPEKALAAQKEITLQRTAR
ncbi:c-type cytochrome [Noviherbaspirillum aridicola]|uniref:Cytochrome n=1 Tax=Noviherbaspirillum aridicola TaxID=2849687 RepID=A0ABQ4Q0B7_9BURK|nr:cytochrome c [Noviherbaspirillum aridicola]GIZ50209.1 cytochrome [Noviherbaspirillum aridicola]